MFHKDTHLGIFQCGPSGKDEVHSNSDGSRVCSKRR